MATILIRGVPAETAAALAAQAERSRRSKEKQALFLIESGLNFRPSAKDILKKLVRIQNACKREVTAEELVKWTKGPE